MTNSNIVKWGSYTPEAAEAEAEQLENSKGGSSFYKFKAGKNLLRFMPPPLGKTSPFKIVWTHSVNLPDGTFVSFACPTREHRKPCPVCQKADMLKASGNPADYDRAKSLFCKQRVYANVIDREAPELGPQVVGFGRTILDPLVALRKDPDAGGDYTDPMTGFDIVVERKGSGKNDTEYKVFPARKQSPLGDLEWIEMQHNLDVYAKLLTPEEIRAKLTPSKKGDQQQQDADVVEAPRVQRSLAPPAPRQAAARTIEHDTHTVGSDEDVPF